MAACPWGMHDAVASAEVFCDLGDVRSTAWRAKEPNGQPQIVRCTATPNEDGCAPRLKHTLTRVRLVRGRWYLIYRQKRIVLNSRDDKQDLIQQNRLPRRRLVRRMPVEDADVGRRVRDELLAARLI